MKGDPRCDNTPLWSVGEPLYAGGMWFKKEMVIVSENHTSYSYITNFSYDGQNRIAKPGLFETPPSNKNLKKGIPANLNDYFFLPAMGVYLNGSLHNFREYGFYWSKTLNRYNSDIAYNLFFNAGEAGLSNFRNRESGCTLWTPK